MKRALTFAAVSLAVGCGLTVASDTAALASTAGSTAPTAANAQRVLADGPCAVRQAYPPMGIEVINICSHSVRFKKIFVGGSVSGCSRVLQPFPPDAVVLNPFESGAITAIRDC